VDLRLRGNAARRQKNKSACKGYFLTEPNPPPSAIIGKTTQGPVVVGSLCDAGRKGAQWMPTNQMELPAAAGPRTKARWFNLEPSVNWGLRVLAYGRKEGLRTRNLPPSLAGWRNLAAFGGGPADDGNDQGGV